MEESSQHDDHLPVIAPPVAGSLGFASQCAEVDAVVVIHAALGVGEPAAVAAAIRRSAAAAGIPVAAALLGTDAGGALTDPAVSFPAVPVYEFPEAAVRAIGHAARHAAWVRRPPGTVPWWSDVDLAAARTVVAAALGTEPAGGWLPAEQAASLVGAFGIPVCRTHVGAVAVGQRREPGGPVGE